MTDQQMHERLKAAGERWRADTPSDVAPSPAVPSPARRPRVFLAIAAAAVVVLVAGLAAVLRTGDSRPTGGSTRTGRPAGPLTSAVAGVLRSHQWQLTTIRFGIGHYRHGAATDDAAVLQFRSSSYVTAHTCSVVHGQAHARGASLVLTPGTTEQHSCPAPVHARYRDQASRAIDEILTGAVRWTVSGPTLTVRSHGGTLTFSAIEDPTRLIGPTWRLTDLRRDGTHHAALDTVTLRFTSDALTVVRCYTSRARVTLDGTSMTVTGLHVTIPLPCPSGPPGAQQQHAALDDLLHGTLAWTLDGRRLVLARGSTTATFVH